MVKVLIVDDMEIARVQISRACAQIGVSNILTAPHAIEALEILKKEEDIQAVISDYNMPEMSGGDFLKEIRQDQRLKDLPFIFITSEGEKCQMDSLKALGITGYITKPFSMDSLKTDLKGYLETVLDLGN